jgi:hypothetical protein
VLELIVRTSSLQIVDDGVRGRLATWSRCSVGKYRFVLGKQIADQFVTTSQMSDKSILVNGALGRRGLFGDELLISAC